MEVSQHVKTQWAIRGDYRRTVTGAWTNGVEVNLSDYNYNRARYDEESSLILLTNGDKIMTVVRYYDHMEMEPVEIVECSECGKEFRGRITCPTCGSDEWESR